MTEFSIVVPVHKMKDNLCEKFLVEYLSSLLNQTFKDYEVVVSDQSEDNALKNICDVFSNDMTIKHVRNTNGPKNAAANVNHGIRHATGRLVKLLYVDDFFVDSRALEKIKSGFDSYPENKWLLSGFVCCDYNKTNYYNARSPWYGNKVVNGDNVTGNPSNYTVRREYALEMDENLLWLVDGEYFYRSYYHYSDPILINDILICFRDYGDSAFHRPDLRELDQKERQYCIDKFSREVELKRI